MKPVSVLLTGLLVALGFLIWGSEPHSVSGQPSLDNNNFLPMVVRPITITEYRSRSLWENAIRANPDNEDFEKDRVSYDEIIFPYTTGNGFLLTGQSAAQILHESHWNSGNFLHFRDWKIGLTFTFPNYEAVSAFGFDYRSSEPWQLTINSYTITLSKDSKSFIGIVVSESYPNKFVLSGWEYAQGGLSVDNISYVTR